MEHLEKSFSKIQRIKAPESLKKDILNQALKLRETKPVLYLWTIRAAAAVMVISLISLASVLQNSNAQEIESVNEVFTQNNNQLYE
mgnify:CR=1 FL=1